MRPVKDIAAATSLAIMLAAFPAAPVLAQTQGENKADAAGVSPRAKPVAAKREMVKPNVDARHCLQLATNSEIHKCAHKYL